MMSWIYPLYQREVLDKPRATSLAYIVFTQIILPKIQR
jgi:hypothetical protein